MLISIKPSSWRPEKLKASPTLNDIITQRRVAVKKNLETKSPMFIFEIDYKTRIEVIKNDKKISKELKSD